MAGFQPFTFMTNGLNSFFWDSGVASPRAISGFFSLEDIEQMSFSENNATLFAAAHINNRTPDALTSRKRFAASATRAAVGLIDLFLRTNYLPRVVSRRPRCPR